MESQTNSVFQVLLQVNASSCFSFCFSRALTIVPLRCPLKSMSLYLNFLKQYGRTHKAPLTTLAFCIGICIFFYWQLLKLRGNFGERRIWLPLLNNVVQHVTGVGFTCVDNEASSLTQQCQSKFMTKKVIKELIRQVWSKEVWWTTATLQEKLLDETKQFFTKLNNFYY